MITAGGANHSVRVYRAGVYFVDYRLGIGMFVVWMKADRSQSRMERPIAPSFSLGGI